MGVVTDYADMYSKFLRLFNDFKGTIRQNEELGCDNILNSNMIYI